MRRLPTLDVYVLLTTGVISSLQAVTHDKYRIYSCIVHVIGDYWKFYPEIPQLSSKITNSIVFHQYNFAATAER